VTTIPEHDASEPQGPGHDAAGQGVPGQGPTPEAQQSRLLDRPRLGGKSIWDWLDLLSKLAIPLVVVLATVGFGAWQMHLADQQHQSDQEQALDQQRAAILQTYIDNMQDLLVNHNLSKSSPAAEISQTAREQTLTTLRRLNAGRNKIVLQFLRDAHLIGMQDAVINLSNTDLSNDDLSGADLSGIDLAGATLTGAQLSGADLSGATLGGADLGRANLSGANLSNAYLFGAFLNGTDLSGAVLSDATLTSAFLGGANMSRAILTGAFLNGANLTGAQLNGASLSGADLVNAGLAGTDLSGADLSDADLLIAAGLTQHQLDTVNSCTFATLSAGLRCYHNVTITLTYWYTESSAEAPEIRKLISQFERQNPRIHIKAVYKNYYQTEAAFEYAAEEGEAPDVLRSDVSWVTHFASQGYLLNIESYISQDDPSDYLPAALTYDYYNGHYYGLPQVTDFLALLYNKEELEKARVTSPPATMADFEADAEKVVQSNPKTYGFETDGTAYDVLPFLYAFGGGMLGRHNEILVNSNGSVNGLKFLLKLQNIDNVMPSGVNFSTGPVTSPVTDFATGKTAMIFGGPYDVPGILAGSSFKSDPGNLGIAGIPTCPAGIPTCHAGQTGSPSGGQSYVISAGTTHPLEAYKFISFMSSLPSQVAIAKENHTLPTRISAQNAVRNEGYISEFLNLTHTVVPQPAIPQEGDLFDAFDPGIADALDGVQRPIAALEAIADAWRQLLAGS
jgi:arabinogalactan oligomer/maltooligosaccharide transport system substrate-binding protein